ncbi:MAG: hypothetical protein WCC10_13155 [Tumebacillaceae bacterium]
MTLDESRKGDTEITESDIPFLFDRRSVTLIAELMVDYDQAKGFSVWDETIPNSQCE